MQTSETRSSDNLNRVTRPLLASSTSVGWRAERLEVRAVRRKSPYPKVDDFRIVLVSFVGEQLSLDRGISDEFLRFLHENKLQNPTLVEVCIERHVEVWIDGLLLLNVFRLFPCRSKA